MINRFISCDNGLSVGNMDTDTCTDNFIFQLRQSNYQISIRYFRWSLKNSDNFFSLTAAHILNNDMKSMQCALFNFLLAIMLAKSAACIRLFMELTYRRLEEVPNSFWTKGIKEYSSIVLKLECQWWWPSFTFTFVLIDPKDVWTAKP